MEQTAHDTLIRVLSKVLRVRPEEITDEMAPETAVHWNSARHLLLVSELETVFGTSLTTDEVIGLKSVAIIKQTLRNHGVNV